MLTLKAHGAAVGAALVLATTAHAATTNGFANGGFETVDTATNQPVGWGLGDSSPPVLSTDAHSGAYSLLLSRPGGFGGSGMEQNSVGAGLAALTDANVGDAPWLSFWAKGDASPTGNAKYVLRYVGDAGVLYDSGFQYFENQLNTSSWTQISFQAAAIPAGTRSVYLLMNTAVGPLLDGRVNAIYVDDIQLTLTTAPVPEPSTYALLAGGLAVLGMAARRRRV